MRTIPMPQRLSWRLLLGILPPIVLAVSAIVWLQYTASRAQLLKAINREMSFQAERTTSAIDDLIEQRSRDLMTLSETSLIADYYRNVDFQLLDEARVYRKELGFYLANFAARNQVYAQILFLDAAGREVAAVRPRPLPSRPSHAGAEYFEKARAAGPAGWWISSIEELDGVGPVLYFSKPVYDEQKAFRGALVLTYDLTQLREMLRSIAVAGRGGASITTADGRRLDGAVSRAPGGLLEASSALRTRPWTVHVQAPLEDFLGPLREVKNAAILTSLVGLAALIGILLLMVRSITRPIAALVEAAREIGEGDFGRRIEDAGAGELRTLADAFNDMAAHLEENLSKNLALQSQLIQAEKLSAVGQLISSVAHELNNPLGSISAYVQLAQLENRADERLREDLKRVYGNVLRCRKVVDNLLFFVRQSAAERKKVNLNEAVDSALELLEYRLLKTEDVRVVRESASEPPEIAGDFQQIVQVLVNLVGNACDAMESGVRSAAGKRLDVRTGVDGKKAYIEIEDNGPGVPEPQRERIFQPFYTTKAPGRGTGLGLPISRQIAREHGGDILVRDAAGGRGSVFRLELQLGSAEELERIEAPAVAAVLPAAPGKRALVADDEADIANVIARLLREDGDAADVATDGAAALAAIAAAPYDLVISDIEMEHAKGMDLYAALEAKGAFPATKILFVTGDILNPKVLEFLTRTNSEYLVKPFDIQELRQAFRRLLA